MTLGTERNSMRRQRGWIGLIVLLIALVIVGMLMKTVMQQYGFLGATGGAAAGAKSSRLPPAVSPVAPDVTENVPSPQNAMERARSLDMGAKQDAIDKKIDESLK